MKNLNKESNQSRIDSMPFKGLFLLLILLLASGLLKEYIASAPFIKIHDEQYTIKMRKPNYSEKHLEGLKQDEIALLKHMAKMIVKHVIRTA